MVFVTTLMLAKFYVLTAELNCARPDVEPLRRLFAKRPSSLMGFAAPNASVRSVPVRHLAAHGGAIRTGAKTFSIGLRPRLR